MRALGYVLSLFGTGLVVLYLAFTLLAEIRPAEAVGATAVAGVVALLLALRGVRQDFELRSQGGDPELRTAINRQRERRGF